MHLIARSIRPTPAINAVLSNANGYNSQYGSKSFLSSMVSASTSSRTIGKKIQHSIGSKTSKLVRTSNVTSNASVLTAATGLIAFSLMKVAKNEAADINNNSKYVLLEDGTWGVSTKDKKPKQTPKDSDLPIMSLEEVEKHNSASSLYVIYNGYVYDITSFIIEHPGGKEPLLGAGGQDISAFWEKYLIHFSKDALSVLEKYKIGKLSEKDAEIAKTKSAQRVDPNTGKEVKSVTLAQYRGYKQLFKLALLASTWPIMEFTRQSFKLLGTVGYYFGVWHILNLFAGLLPFSIPGYRGAQPLYHKAGEKQRVCVVGGGIAGVGTAFALKKSGFDVVIYESRDKLGGNAQTATFTTPSGKKITQDLSVLFWAPEYYKNYVNLLKETGASVENTQVAYLLHTNVTGEWAYYTPKGTEMFDKMQPNLYEKYKKDFDRYDFMIKLVRYTNNCFTLDPSPSFYKHTGIWPIFNPMNFIPLRTLSWMCGMSDEFYVNILRPFQGYNFSTALIDDLPAVALAVLDDIVSLTSTRSHQSWGVGNSTVVFERASQGCDVRLSTRVRQVLPQQGKNGKHIVIDDKGGVEEYDRVVFACPAGMAANVLRNKNWIESTLLDAVEYHDDWKNSDALHWLEVPVHTDDSIVPNTNGLRDYIKKHFAFVVDIDAKEMGNGSYGGRYDHLLGAWSPTAKAMGEHGADMYMSQALRGDEKIDESKIICTFSPPRAHPTMGVRNMMVTQLLSVIQGRRGIYYVGNYVSAGNGHDLSLVTGLCVAEAIGAKYPWPENKASERDVKLMSRFMGL